MSYAYLAIACGALGAIITLITVLVCGVLNVDITTHLWILAIPITLTLIINISLVELYDRVKRKNQAHFR
ncbi:MAG: hypothetical protein Q7T05_04790 [Dehalococcoidia bacterium]|nr:hypothetical protein [Dehalococcoidia bacterium]